jgi:hypothetical protein
MAMVVVVEDGDEGWDLSEKLDKSQTAWESPNPQHVTNSHRERPQGLGPKRGVLPCPITPSTPSHPSISLTSSRDPPDIKWTASGLLKHSSLLKHSGTTKKKNCSHDIDLSIV